MQTRTGPGFYILLAAVLVATFALHEGGHWLAAVLLGHDAFYGLNSAGARSVVSADHKMIVDAAGPIVTVVQGLIAFAVIQVRPNLTAFAFLWSAAFMRLMAGLISFIHLNDEGRLSVGLGLPAFVLPVAVAGLLVGLTVIGGRRLKLSWRAWVLSWLVGSAAVAAVVYLDVALNATPV